MKQKRMMTKEFFVVSLMLTPIEERTLEQALKKAHQQDTQKIQLNGLICIDPGTWTIWINNTVIKSSTHSQRKSREDIRILKVSSDSVELLWTPKPDREHRVCLKLHQCFEDK